MWQLFFAEMTPWAAIALAFVPVAVIATITAFLSHRIDRANDNLMTSIARVSGAALVFISAFTIATIWQQTSAHLNDVAAEFSASLNLERVAETATTPEATEAVLAALGNYANQVYDHELGGGVSFRGSDEGNAAFSQVRAQVSASQQQAGSTEAATSLESALTKLTDARAKRLDFNGQPGVPIVVILTIMLLAWTVTAVLGIYPLADQGWVKAFQVTALVTVVGLIQLPIYYLGSTESTHELVIGLLLR